MNVFLVSSGQAEALMRDAVGDVTAALGEQAARMIRLFHDRHIGIPPSLALDFAKGFAPQAPEFANPVRLTIYVRLLEALGATASMKQDPRQFDAIPRHLLFDLCLRPLTAKITEALGETYLFSLSADVKPLPVAQYKTYADDFVAYLHEICKPTDRQEDDDLKIGPWDLFWEKCAYQLWGALQRTRHRRGNSTADAMSQVFHDDVLLRMIHTLDAQPEIRMPDNRQSIDLTEEQNRFLSHPKQGGVVGIHMTSRAEDIEDMLISEYALPPYLLADKLLNSSFLARHRPPPLDERQQLMLMGICLDEGEHSALALAKTCWLEAIFRMAIVLFKSELFGSEIRFGQWREQAGLAKSGMRVGDYVNLGKLNLNALTRSQLYRFFGDAGWLPGFLSLMPTPEARSGNGLARGLRQLGPEPRLQSILDALFPEADQPVLEDKHDYRAAMLVVIRRARMKDDPVELSGREWVVPISTSTIDCPDQLVGGASFVFEDSQGQPCPVEISGERGKPATKDALDRAAGLLVSHLLKFYWERIDG